MENTTELFQILLQACARDPSIAPALTQKFLYNVHSSDEMRVIITACAMHYGRVTAVQKGVLAQLYEALMPSLFACLKSEDAQARVALRKPIHALTPEDVSGIIALLPSRARRAQTDGPAESPPPPIAAAAPMQPQVNAVSTDGYRRFKSLIELGKLLGMSDTALSEILRGWKGSDGKPGRIKVNGIKYVSEEFLKLHQNLT